MCARHFTILPILPRGGRLSNSIQGARGCAQPHAEEGSGHGTHRNCNKGNTGNHVFLQSAWKTYSSFLEFQKRKTLSTHAVTKTATIPSAFSQYVQDLRVERETYPRLLIFCRTISDCANIYEFFHQRLGLECTHPIGAPDISHFRLVDMYTSVTTPGVKDQIQKHMQQGDSSLRVLICTNAFENGYRL